MSAGALATNMPTSRLENFSWNCAKVFAAFFFGGIVLAWLLDVFLLSITVVADQSLYPNRLGAMIWNTVPNSLNPVVTILFFVPIFYAIPQFFSASLALLSFVVIKRVSLLWIIVTTPLTGFAYGQSFFADAYWTTVLDGLLANARWHHLINCILQVPISVGCWWIAGKLIRLWKPS